MTGKTLAELNAQVGDVFCYSNFSTYEILPNHMLKNTNKSGKPISYDYWDCAAYWTLVSRAVPPAKYGEWQITTNPDVVGGADSWKFLSHGVWAYRVLTKPVVVEKEAFVSSDKNGFYVSGHKPAWGDLLNSISLNIVDGVPDCDSIKMVKL